MTGTGRTSPSGIATLSLGALLACVGCEGPGGRTSENPGPSIPTPTTPFDSLIARAHALAAPIDARFDSLRSELVTAAGTPRADSVLVRARRSLESAVYAYQRAIDDTAFQSAIWPEYRQVHGGPAPTRADSSAADSLRRALALHGIWSYAAEGDSYLSPSQRYLQDLARPYLTPAGRDFLDIELREQVLPVGGDGSISIPWDSLADRLASTDRFLLDHPGSAMDSLVKARRIVYLRGYLTGWDNTSVFATRTQPFRTEARASYERFVRVRGATPSAEVVRQYLDVLSAAAWRRTGAVQDFLRAHLDGRP